MDASAFGVAITSLPYEMVPNYFTWDGASGVWVRFCVSDATFSQDAAADEGDAAVVRSVRVLGVVGEWWTEAVISQRTCAQGLFIRIISYL